MRQQYDEPPKTWQEQPALASYKPVLQKEASNKERSIQAQRIISNECSNMHMIYLAIEMKVPAIDQGDLWQ